MEKRSMRWGAACVCLMVLAGVMASCGDDDTTGPPPLPNAALKGDYFVVAYEHDVDVSTAVSVTGVLRFDGAGKYAGRVTLSLQGNVETDSVRGNYEVGTGRGLTLTESDGQLMSGGLDPSYATAVVGRINAGGKPMFGVMLRQAGAYTRATLSGTYHIAGIQYESETYSAFTGTADLDSTTGTCNLQAVNNWGGTIVPLNVSTSYAVASGGELFLSNPSTATVILQGGVLASGDMAIAATVGAGEDPRLVVLIRQAGTFAPATVAETHWYVSMGPEDLALSMETGVIDFDGTDGWTTAATKNLNGTIGTSAASGTYAITPDGRLALNVSGGVVQPLLEFGVRFKGQAATGACITPGVPPVFVAAVRK